MYQVNLVDKCNYTSNDTHCVELNTDDNIKVKKISLIILYNKNVELVLMCFINNQHKYIFIKIVYCMHDLRLNDKSPLSC